MYMCSMKCIGPDGGAFSGVGSEFSFNYAVCCLLQINICNMSANLKLLLIDMKSVFKQLPKAGDEHIFLKSKCRKEEFCIFQL